MKTFNEIVANTENKDADFTVALSIDDRKMSRIITRTEEGCEVAISVDRGLVLKDGQFIKNEDGKLLKVEAALEEVTTVKARTVHDLLTLAYHLGNRHVPLEVGKDNFLRYQTYHVLDEMVLKLGGFIIHETAKFSPENGAYSHHHSH